MVQVQPDVQSPALFIACIVWPAGTAVWRTRDEREWESHHVTRKTGISTRLRAPGDFYYIRSESMSTILLIILILLLIGALPTWPYSGSWGYYPSSGLGLIVVIVLVLVVLGRV